MLPKARYLRFATAAALFAMVLLASLAVSQLLQPPGVPLSFVQEARIAGFSLPLNAWSPTEELVALTKPDGLYILDLREGLAKSPRLLVTGRVTAISWSPTGGVLACRTQSEMQIPTGRGDLLAIDAHNGLSERIGHDLPFHEFQPNRDGAIMIWDDARAKLRGLTPRRVKPSGATTGRQLRPLVIPGTSGKQPQIMHIANDKSSAYVSQRSEAPFAQFFVVDAFPDGQRLLASSQRTIVTDMSGNTIKEIDSGSASFSGTTVTRSGRFVLGYTARDSINSTVESRIVAYDVANDAFRPISAPPGYAPQASRMSDRILYQGFGIDGVILGRLRDQK